MPTTENPLATAAESVSVKVAWLKQKKDVNKRLPILEFDDQQFYTFDRRRTTFRMVKHSCSYPAPPHKVRMWCSSLGASPDLPSSMDLNSFINTFELITEEKHTLEMAHLTGGETIAFEMVQGEPVSELSTFLLGAQLKQSAGLLPAGAGLSSKIVTAADKKKMKELTAPAVQQLEDLGVNVGAALAGAAGGGAPPFDSGGSGAHRVCAQGAGDGRRGAEEKARGRADRGGGGGGAEEGEQEGEEPGEEAEAEGEEEGGAGEQQGRCRAREADVAAAADAVLTTVHAAKGESAAEAAGIIAGW